MDSELEFGIIFRKFIYSSWYRKLVFEMVKQKKNLVSAFFFVVCLFVPFYNRKKITTMIIIHNAHPPLFTTNVTSSLSLSLSLSLFPFSMISTFNFLLLSLCVVSIFFFSRSHWIYIECRRWWSGQHHHHRCCRRRRSRWLFGPWLSTPNVNDAFHCIWQTYVECQYNSSYHLFETNK